MNNEILNNNSEVNSHNSSTTASDNEESDNSSISCDENSDAVSTSSDEKLEHSDNLNFSGQLLRNYNIIYELGRGSYSIVWLAFHRNEKKFRAIKVQDSSDFKEGLDEIKFVQKLPKHPNIFNNLLEYFIENKNNKKYLCSVWNLHLCNLDTLIRKCNYKEGLPLNIVKIIMKQLITSLYILHTKFKVYHGDIKTDNILVKGINNRDKFICDKYLDKINDNHQNYALHHENVSNSTIAELNNSDILNFSIDENYINNINISLADFGTFCDEKTHFTGTFGTRYYQAPEIILLSKCSYPVDIWALGCTFYELLSGEILFNPIKDSQGSRDYYHLCLITETCGNFPKNFLKKTKKYKDFFNNYNLINYNNPNNDRLNKKINILNLYDSDKIIIKNLLKSMLSIDPNDRCKIEFLNKEKYFN
jgi:serine/threonine protein kinase